MKEVEIIKLGDIFNSTITIINNGDSTVEHYNKILIDNCEGFDIEETSADIYERFGDVARGKISKGKSRNGKEDGRPIVGESYTLDNSSWHTSRIERVIDDCILITKNSVYAIHTVSELRDKKLKELGI